MQFFHTVDLLCGNVFFNGAENSLKMGLWGMEIEKSLAVL